MRPHVLEGLLHTASALVEAAAVIVEEPDERDHDEWRRPQRLGRRGATSVGTSSVTWEARDVFTLPHDTWIVHRAEETSYLFVASDRELYRRLDLLVEAYDER